MQFSHTLIQKLLANDHSLAPLEKVITSIEDIRQLMIVAKLNDWIYQWFSKIYLKLPKVDAQIAKYFLQHIANNYPVKQTSNGIPDDFTYQNSLSYHYRDKLNQHRTAIEKIFLLNKKENMALSNDKLQQSHKDLHKFNQQIYLFLKQLLEKAHTVLGDFRIDYCLIALGSLSRQAMLPYSDIELFLLVKNDYDKPLLKKILALFEFFIACIHEPNGFHLDNHTQHLATDPLVIDEAKKYITRLLASDGKAREKHSDEMLCSLIHAEFIDGDSSLFDQYQQDLQSLLLLKNKQSVNHQQWAISQMQRHQNDFAKVKKQTTLDLKNDLLKPLTFCLLDLALYIIQACKKKFTCFTSSQQI